MRNKADPLTVCPSQYIDRPWVKKLSSSSLSTDKNLFQLKKIFKTKSLFQRHHSILKSYLQVKCSSGQLVILIGFTWNPNEIQYHHRKCNLFFIPEIVPDCTCRRQPRRSRTGGHRAATRSPGHCSPSEISSWSPFPFHLFMSGFCFAYRLATVVLLVQPHPRLFSLLVVDDGGVVSKVKSVALLVQHEGVGLVKEGLRLQRLKNL